MGFISYGCRGTGLERKVGVSVIKVYNSFRQSKSGNGNLPIRLKIEVTMSHDQVAYMDHALTYCNLEAPKNDWVFHP